MELPVYRVLDGQITPNSRQIKGTSALAIVLVLAALLFLLLLAGCSEEPAIGAVNYDASVALMRFENLDDGVSGVVYRQVNRFSAVLAESKTPVLVVFYSVYDETTARIQPFLEQMADDYQGKLAIIWIDADAEKDLANSFQVDELPQFTVVVEGALRRSLVGFGEDGENKIKELVLPYLAQD
jgi:thioredoxin 1